MLVARHHALRDRTLAAVDHALAEPVLLKMRVGESVQIDAILQVAAGEETSVSGGRDREFRTRINAQGATLHIDRARYPDIAGRDVKEVRALSRPGQPWFEVLAVDDRGMSRLVLRLGESA